VNVSPTVADSRYRAFITYSHQDENWAVWLQKALETYRVPARLVGMHTEVGTIPRRLTPIFRDRSELPSAADLKRVVNEALSASANLIVICSPHSAVSNYVNEEITAFKQLGRASRIFCLVIAGEPNASDSTDRKAEECFAPALRHEVGTDGGLTQKRAAPVAADARAGKDGRTNAKLKVIAGMLGIGFDALKQREHQRHMRRMIAVTAVSLLAMLITTGLSINAVIARKNAVVARQAAERRQKQAEILIEFMLGDLNDKLSQVQRLDILEVTNNQAMKFFQSLPTTDMSDQVLVLRAKALENIGSIRTSQGKLPAALAAYQAASALTRELAMRAPRDSARQVAYGNSLNWIGNAYWYQGELNHSLQNFQRAIEILQKEAAARPDDTELVSNLASARTNAGRVFEARGEYEPAKELYVLVQQAFEALRTREPNNAHWQSELGYAYNNLGKVALEQGQLVQAIEAYRDDQRIKAALAVLDPKNYGAQEDLLIADAILGRTLAMCGMEKAAIKYVREAVTLGKALVAFDAAQTLWREDLGSYSQLLGGLLRQGGELEEADRLTADAVRILDELVATDKTNARWARGLASAQVEAARVRIARHDYAAAEQLLDRARATIKAARATTPADVNLIVLAAEANIGAGDLAARRPEPTAGDQYWRQARDLLAPIAMRGNDPYVLAPSASASLLLNDTGAARPMLQKLGAMGYRTPDLDALLAAKKVPYRVDPEVVRRITRELALDARNQRE
jgi:tetratricopeptide (TPR) repeat protein